MGSRDFSGSRSSEHPRMPQAPVPSNMPDRSAMRLYLLQRLCQIAVKKKKAGASIDCKLLRRNVFLECSTGGTPRAKALHRAWHSGRGCRGAAFTRARSAMEACNARRADDDFAGRGEQCGSRDSTARRIGARHLAWAGVIARGRGRRSGTARRTVPLDASIDLERLQLDRQRDVDRPRHAGSGRSAVDLAVERDRVGRRQRDRRRPVRRARGAVAARAVAAVGAAERRRRPVRPARCGSRPARPRS